MKNHFKKFPIGSTKRMVHFRAAIREILGCYQATKKDIDFFQTLYKKEPEWNK